MKLPRVFCAAGGVILTTSLLAAPNIDPVKADAYGANVGWINWRPATTAGASLGEQFLSGQVWSATCGWISLGDGAPANGYRYQNDSSSDFGVNLDPNGDLSGRAYGANIGWILFTNRTPAGPLPVANQPKVDLKNGRFQGYCYSANCGWISLSNDFGQLKALGIDPGLDTDGDGIPDAWEMKTTGGLAALRAGGDLDHDGVSDREEYFADTNPTDPADQLRLTQIQATAGGAKVSLTWKSSAARCYGIEQRDALGAGSWVNSGLPGGAVVGAGATTSVTLTDVPQAQRYFRVKSLRPGIDTAF